MARDQQLSSTKLVQKHDEEIKVEEMEGKKKGERMIGRSGEKQRSSKKLSSAACEQERERAVTSFGVQKGIFFFF